ncbi:hypothetical protein GF376_03440 [Candidatus Peregrinibacteria bacterium]|nr:hypothetical protein [Candidatus Peregrinibacteria bacterium]
MIKIIKKQIKGSKRAETLLEVIIAIGMISIAAATSATLIVTSLNAVSFNKDSLIALNLAQEGLEAVKNLRDTNWIKFSSAPERCWNLLPGELSCPNPKAQVSFLNSSSEYSLTETLEEQSDTLDLEDGTDDAFRIRRYDINSDGVADFSRSGVESGALDSTKYYRSISIEYKNVSYDESNNLYTTSTSNFDVANTMIVTSKVQWFGNDRVNTIELQSALSQYR